MLNLRSITIAFIVVAIIVGILLAFLSVRYVSRQVPLQKVIKSMIGDIKEEIEVTSPAFTRGGKIPSKYTCDGMDVSPPLRWSTVSGAKYYAIIVIDPDAPRGVFIHWILYNIPAQPIRSMSIKEGVPSKAIVDNTLLQARNDFGKIGYGGPCPPRGSKHRYVFIVLALKDRVNVNPGSNSWKVLKALRDVAIAYGYTYGYYSR